MTSKSEGAPRDGLRPSFIGRVQEIACVEQALDEADAGLGCSLVLSGEPGIGKSALADEALRRARARGFATARAYCTPIDGQVLDPIATVFEALMGHVPSSGGEHGSDLSLPGVASDLRRLVRATPLAIVIEDVHWAGRPAMARVDWLARQLRDVPLVWIFTARLPALPMDAAAEQDVATLLQIPGVIHLVLPGFTVAEISELVESERLDELDREDLMLIRTRSRGNPLLIKEFARAQLRGDRGIAPVIDKLFGDLLNGLDEDARGVLALCALAGGTIRHELLQRVGYALSLDVVNGVESAVRQGVLARRPELSAYACRHPLLTDVTATATDATRAAQIHAVLAGALTDDPGLALSSPAAEIAHHRIRAGDDAAALEALLAAADEADRLHAPSSVLAHLEKAIELHPVAAAAASTPSLAALLMRASYAAEVVGRNRDAVRLARQAVAVDDEAGPELSTRHLLLAEVLRRGHHPPSEADAAVERAAELIGDDPGPAALQLAVARAWSWDSDPESAVVHGRRAIEQAESMAVPPLLAQAMVQTGGALAMLGDTDGGIALARRGRAVATEAGFEVGALTSYVPIAAMLTFTGSPSAGADEALAGLHRCGVVADPATLRSALAGWAAYGLFLAGRWAEVSDLSVEEPADGIYATMLPLVTASLAAFQGKAHVAAEIIDKVGDEGVGADPYLALASAWAAWCSGDAERAYGLARSAVRRRGISGLLANELTFLGALCAQPEDAAGLLADLVEPERASVLVHQWARSARAAVHDDEVSWREALEGWRALDGWPHLVVICSTRLALRTSEREGQDLVIGALSIARQLGSPVLTDFVTAAAADAHLDVGVDNEVTVPQLTPREDEVLEHLATGATNRQIARSLGISEGTVSVHVSNLLRKLGVGSRTEAALVAARFLEP